MRQALAQADGFEFGAGAFEGIRATGEFQRHCNVFESGHVRNQVKRLEDDADGAAADSGEFILGQIVKRFAGNLDLAGIEPLKPGDDHQQRRLA